MELATSEGIFVVDRCKQHPLVEFLFGRGSLSAASLRAVSGRQPRGKEFPEMVPDFSGTVKRAFDRTVRQAMNLAPGNKPSASAASAIGLAFVAKVVNVDIKVGSSRVEVFVWHIPYLRAVCVQSCSLGTSV